MSLGCNTFSAGKDVTFEDVTSTQDIFLYKYTSLAEIFTPDSIEDAVGKYLTGIDLFFKSKPTNATKDLKLYIQESGDRLSPWYTSESLKHFEGTAEISDNNIMHIDLDNPYKVAYGDCYLRLMFDFSSANYEKVAMYKKIRLYYTEPENITEE